MELRQLRYFIGISEAGSLLKASSRLHVAQPALSQQMAALEQDVGARLLERSSRGVTLTEAGKAFLAHARVVLDDVERARQAACELAGAPSGPVAIGLPTTVGLVATVPLLQACQQQLPRVQLRIVEGYSGFLREWLLAGRVDIALLFGAGPDPALVKRPLVEDRLVLVTAASGRRGPRRMALGGIADWPLILPGRGHGLRNIIDEACQPQGIVLDVVAEVESLSSVKRAVEAGLGATILPYGSVAEEVAAGRLRTSHIDGPSMLRHVVCASSVTRPMTSAGAAVIELVHGLIRRMAKRKEWPVRWVGTEPGG